MNYTMVGLWGTLSLLGFAILINGIIKDRFSIMLGGSILASYNVLWLVLELQILD